MHYLAVFRAWCALGIAWSSMATAATVALGGGVPYGICVDPFIGRWVANPFARIPKWWAAFVTHVCYRGILGVRIVVRNHAAHASTREHVVCIGNHPTEPTFPVVGWVITRDIAPYLVAVGKREHAWNPLIGWPLLALRAIILIDRENRSAARASIRAGISRLADAARAIILFPDMRRPTPERIATDRAAFGDRILGIRAWLRHTLVPRTGGLSEILSNVDASTRIIHVTSAFDVEEFGVADASRIVGRTLYVDLEEHGASLPAEPNALACCLNRIWEEKNRRIAAWRAR